MKRSAPRSLLLVVPACALLLVVLARASLARAQQAPPSAEREATDELLRAGVRERVAGHDDRAVVTFDAAVRRCDCGEAYAQRGLASLALGRWLASYEDLERALSGPADPWVARNRVELETARDAAGRHRAVLFIECGSESGPVRVEGALAGLCAPGRTLTHARSVEGPAVLARVELARPEHPALLEVRSGAERPVTVRLPPRPPSPARAPRDPRPALRITAATSSALALAAVALGAAASAQREEFLTRFNDDNRCLLGSRTRSENCGPDERAALQWQGASAAGFALGALLGAGALASGVASALLRAPSATPRVSILPPGLHVEGSF